MNKSVSLWNRRFPQHDMFLNFDKMFDDFAGPAMRSSFDQRTESRIKETDEAYLISIDMPGVLSENLNIEVKDNVLSIMAERHDLKDEDGQKQESHFTYSRKWSLPETVNQDGLEAHLEHGVLNIALPKQEPEQAKKITVKDTSGPFLKRLLGKSS